MNTADNIKSVVWASESGDSKTISITVAGSVKVLFLNKAQRKVTGWSSILVPLNTDGCNAIRSIYSEETIDVNDSIMSDGGVAFARVWDCSVMVAPPAAVIAAASPTVIIKEDAYVLDELCRIVYDLCKSV